MREARAGDPDGPGGRHTAGPASERPQSGRTLRMGFVLDVAGYGTRSVPDRDDVQRRLRRLVVAISDQAYTLIIQPGYPGIPAGQFTQTNVTAKEFSGPAWIWLSARQWVSPGSRAPWCAGASSNGPGPAAGGRSVGLGHA